MVLATGTYWKAEYGEISDNLEFRIGYVGQDSWDAYFPIAQLPDLIAVLNGVTPLSVGGLYQGSQLQARKVFTGFKAFISVEPKSNLYPVQIVRFEESLLSDLTSTLTTFQSLIIYASPSSWDSKQVSLSDIFNSPVFTGEPTAPTPSIYEPNQNRVTTIGTLAEFSNFIGDQLHEPTTLSRMTDIGSLMQPYQDTPWTGLTQAYGNLVTGDFTASPLLIDPTDSRLTFIGGNPVLVDSGVPAYGYTNRPTGGTNAQPLMFRFTFKGTRFGMFVTNWGAGDIWVWVDGKPVQLPGYVATPAVSGEQKYYSVKGFPDAVHDVQVVMGIPLNLIKVMFQPGTRVVARPKPRYRLSVGPTDSYGDLGLPPYWGGLMVELHRLTGFEIGQLGQGSTGVNNPGLDGGGNQIPGKSVYGSTARLDALQAFNPHLILTALPSLNDGGWSFAQNKAAGAAFLQAVASRLPNARVILLPPEPLNVTGVDQVILNALVPVSHELAAEYGNVAGVLDWRTEDWLTGTGSLYAPANNGNQDFYIGTADGLDQIHPNRDGQVYLASMMVEGMRKMKAIV